MIYYLALGSNQPVRLFYLKKACQLIEAKVGFIKATSSVYLTNAYTKIPKEQNSLNQKKLHSFKPQIDYSKTTSLKNSELKNGQVKNGQVKNDASKKTTAKPKFKIINQLSNNYFLNVVIRLKSPLKPWDMLAKLKLIEAKLGKKPAKFEQNLGQKIWQDRTIDIDIILTPNFSIQTAKLTIPHYDLLNRAFFLKPLLQINPKARLTTTGELLKLYLAKFSLSDLNFKKLDIRLI